MPFDSTDPRAALGASDHADPLATAFAAAQYIPFTEDGAQLSGSGTRTWFVRTQNAVVSYTVGLAGDRIAPAGGASERLLALPDHGTSLRIENGDQIVTVVGPAAATVAPGATTLTFITAGPVVQIFTAAAVDLLDRCVNAGAYVAVPPNVRMHDPEPSRESSIRVYPLADHPATTARFGNIYRSTNLMINFINDRHGPRDPTKLSPHSHPDFEQCSIQLGGLFRHHVRTPWTPDLNAWRDDEHVELDGPGAIIFPPPMIHTSQAIGSGVNRLIDAFAPPRSDFLAKTGWVLNADEYEVTEEHRSVDREYAG